MLEGGRKRTTSYYQVLGVAAGSSADDIRRAYRKQAMRWHPDRWTKDPSLAGEAKRRFQQIQEAYSVLSDQKKRSLYDAGLYDPENEGFFDFVQELASFIAQTREESDRQKPQDKQYSMEELQTMFAEMIHQFDSEPLFRDGPKAFDVDLDEATDEAVSFSIGYR
ncbi:PREDICTED: uncharacterized protein LOC104823014 isoform X2 [Tarenaya hassleriana]|uniref:uncharacterized protein LOC104823014 isoform X2 n=1 Tax=Tarenaya hassleriana TaxID=28532 RepID=UPI00053C64F2|nr:PREDICTED: uncharacterized protein LOC104823014 isoform X2 [Tarenaya hassleriana]